MIVVARVYLLKWKLGTRFKDDRGWQFVSTDCGHDVMVNRPQELADVLIAAA